MASSNHPLQRQPRQRGEVPTSPRQGPKTPTPLLRQSAASLPHTELSKASTSTLEHKVPKLSVNRRGLPGPGKEPAAQLPRGPAQPLPRGAAPTLSLPPTRRTTAVAMGCSPGPGLKLRDCSPRARVSEEKGSPWPGQRGPKRKGGEQGHEKQGGRRSEVDGAPGLGDSEVEGVPGLRGSEVLGVPEAQGL